MRFLPFTYWTFRIATALFGTVIVSTIVASSISPPNIEAPSPLDMPLLYGLFLVIGIVFLIPNRWTSRGFSFYGRLVIYAVASSWMINKGVEEIYFFHANGFGIAAGALLLILSIATIGGLLISHKYFPEAY